MTIDESAARLAVLLPDRGFEPPSPPGDTGVIDAIERAVAPLRLPREVRRIWELIDVATLDLWTWPQLQSPKTALQSRELQLEMAESPPPPELFPLGYSSHCFTLVELHSAEADDGGAVFEYCFASTGFHLVHTDVAEWLAGQVDAVAAGNVVDRDNHVSVDIIPLAEERAAERLERHGPHPVHGELVTVPEFPEDTWPARWTRPAR